MPLGLYIFVIYTRLQFKRDILYAEHMQTRCSIVSCLGDLDHAVGFQNEIVNSRRYT